MKKIVRSTKEKKERNMLIIELIEKGEKSLKEIGEMFGLRAKSTVHNIYKRAQTTGKYGVRKLSTGIEK